MYIYQLKKWPNFTWKQEQLFDLLKDINHQQGRLLGKMGALGFSLQNEAVLKTMTLEVLKSNEIEGEVLNPGQVRSSIARKLGMAIAGLVPSNRNVEGVVEIAIDAARHFKEPLTEERLLGWQSALFPGGRSGIYKIIVGAWRNSPMEVVSGAMGKEKVHFEAPNAELLANEMKRFLDWFNSNTPIDAIIKAAIAHLWFVTIHPFDDGNGRIARTIADMQLARADGISQRFYSMSAQIQLERKGYYDMLEKTQKGGLDITEWIEWFLVCLYEALKATEETLSGVLKKARYWEWLGTKKLNERQKLMLNKLLDGFEGKLTSSKWAKITKRSQDTAQRDIENLIEQGILEKEAKGGRSTNYKLVEISYTI
jgi:Fic family protein